MTKKNFTDLAKSCSFVLFYGSQTGQAESISETIVQQAPSYDFTAEAFPLNDIRDIKDLANFPCPIVIVSSTTGDGEPPENADRFWRKIRKRIFTDQTLASLKYSILGLGDTNYNQFCHCGKEIDKKLKDLGAVRFYPAAWADDAVGLEHVVDDWIEGLWPVLDQLIQPERGGQMSKPRHEGGLQLPICPPASLQLKYENDMKVTELYLAAPIQPYPLMDNDPVPTEMTAARYLTKPGAAKTALEITLKFKSTKAKFEFVPGDALGVICPNSSVEVERILERLNLKNFADKVVILSVKEKAKGKIPSYIPPGSSLRQLFTYYCDIRTPPKKTFLRLLAEYTLDELEKTKLLELSSRQGSPQFEATVRVPGLSLLDMLLTFPSCVPPPEVLIEHLPRLIPRAYSVSSSPLKNKESFTFAFNVITFSADEGRKYPRAGVCTGWFYNAAMPFLTNKMDSSTPNGIEDYLSSEFAKVSLSTEAPADRDIIVYKRKNHNFRLPENMSVPIVLVGPGTGIAPFLGFAEQRHYEKKNGMHCGEIYLYFGCRHKALDFLYEEELSELFHEKIITKLYTSFSRDQSQTIKYVQDNIKENQEEIVQTLLDSNGYLYVCGDAKNMAKNVRDTIIQCIQSVKGISEEEAKVLVAELVSCKRYLQDVWN